MDALTDTSSPASIYQVCATYRCLYSLRHLTCVAKLISCITSHNHTYKFATLDAAYNDHRLLTVNPGERQRRRKQRRVALVEERDSLRAQLQQQQQQQQQQQPQHEPPLPPPPSSPRSLPPSPTPQRQEAELLQGDGTVSSTSVSSPSSEPSLPSAASSSSTTDRDRVQHLEGVVAQLSHQLTQSSHRDALQVQRQQDYADDVMMQLLAHKVKPAQLRSSLGQEWIELVLTMLNRRQNEVRFIGPTGAGEYFEARPDRAVVVRVMQIPSISHWVVGLWRVGTYVIRVLDSARAKTSDSVRKSPLLTRFVGYCTRFSGGPDRALRVEFSTVAAQRDDVSCGLFVVAFCRAIAASGGAMDDERLLRVDVEATRQWLVALAKWMKSSQDCVPSDDVINSIAHKNTASRRSKRQIFRARDEVEVE